MIKLTRPPKPQELTSDEEQRLTQEYQDDGKSVWREDYIVDALLTMSHKKCAYCERQVAKGSPTFHIDHYHPKSLYKSEVVAWHNLLPACSDCNTQKGKHDTKASPILNPTHDVPKQFLRMKHYRIAGIDADGIGTRTREVLGLNNPIHDRRTELGQQILVQVTLFRQELREYEGKRDLRQSTKSRLVTRLLTILAEGQPRKEYSAAVATVLLENDEFQEVCRFMKGFNLWSAEIQELYSLLEENALNTRINDDSIT